MWAAAWTTVIGFGILAVLVYFISNRYYPIPYEWRRLITLGVAAALTLGAAWAIGTRGRRQRARAARATCSSASWR